MPTNRDVLCHGQLLKERALEGKQYTNKQMAADLAIIIIAHWEHANSMFKFPVIISKQRVNAKIVELWERMRIFVYMRAGNTKKARELFISKLDKLFDVLHCKCSMKSKKEDFCKKTCPDKLHIHCTCSRETRIPALEHDYVKAQRDKHGSKSKFQLGPVDIVETQRQLKAIQRKHGEKKEGAEKTKLAAEEQLKELEDKMEQLVLEEGLENSSLSDEGVLSDKHDSEFRHEGTDRLMAKLKQNRAKYSTLALTSMRYGVSVRATAAIATATLVDHGMISPLMHLALLTTIRSREKGIE